MTLQFQLQIAAVLAHYARPLYASPIAPGSGDIIASVLQAGSETDPPSVAAARLLQIIEARFGDGLQAAREARAAAPRPDAEALRVAYLDVLKLCLCDLAGTTTASVARTQEGIVMSRELAGDQLRVRAAGLDWPLHGLTMIGLDRLDDLQACVESIVRNGVPGDLIEAGSWRGGASLLMRATLETLAGPAREVYVADSFQGFPATDGDLRDGYDLSSDLAGCDFLAVPLDEVKRTFARFGFEHSLSFVPGFFQDTLPRLAGRQWSIVRLDGDTYDSIKVALASLYPGLSAGGYLIVDDYLSLDECREAVDDFRREHCITEPIEEVDWSGVRWRRDAPSQGGVAPPASEAHAAGCAPAPPRPVRRAPQARVPTIEEVKCREEMERLRQHLAATEADLRRVASSPLIGPSRWLRAKLRGHRAAKPR